VWEFTDTDLGYTYGRPVIAKTAAFGGKWLVMVPSGYNNVSGVGKVFFLDAATGKLLKTMSTGAGDPDSPAGLAQMAAFTKNSTNLKAEQIYAGDLLGNFWRFDVSNADDTKWVVEKLAVLTEPGTGARQPVTTPPQIEIDINNAIDRWVFVGTGKLLHNDDLKDVQRQTFYALRDGSNSKPNVIKAALTRADLVEVKDKDGLGSRPDFGWYDDLPAGERVTVGPQAVISIVAYSGTRPQTDPCLTGLPATIYAREFSRGNSVLEDDFGNIVESIDSPSGAVGMHLLSLESAGPPGSPPLLRIAITQGSDGRTRLIKVKPPEFLSAHRMSWRLLGE
jgi:type IV pilus assembly protein PilY1